MDTMLCCGCKKQPGYLQTQILDPSASNNYLYQQHLLHHQQVQAQQQQQAAAVLAAAQNQATLIPIVGGGQQRFVGGVNYVVQQPATGAAVPGMAGQMATTFISQQPSTQQSQQMLQRQQQQQVQATTANYLTANPAGNNTNITRALSPSGRSTFGPKPATSMYSSMLFNELATAAGHQQSGIRAGRVVSDIGLPPDSMRRIAGITSEVFRQIEAVEAEFDPSTLAAQYAEMERRGEMILRILTPTQIAPHWLEETCRKFGDGITLPSWIQFVEIIKRPGQTLGLYIREGDGFYSPDGVFISRIALESPVYSSGCLRVGDEILAVNMVDVQRMSLDDVVVIMSIPRRLILTIRSRPLNPSDHHVVMAPNRSLYGNPMAAESYYDTVASDIYSRVDDLRPIKPVVVLKQDIDGALEEEEEESIIAAAAAVEAGLLDDPTALATTAAMANRMVRNRSGSLDLFETTQLGRASRAMGLVGGGRSRRALLNNTADNLAELAMSDLYGGRRRSGSLIYNQRPSSRLSLAGGESSRAALMAPRRPRGGGAASLYQGRLATARSRPTPGRLLRTASEQFLSNQIDDQIDYFIDRYNTLRQLRSGFTPEPPGAARRFHSLDRANLRSSFSTQTLGQIAAGAGLQLPPGVDHYKARRKYPGHGSLSDTESSMYDQVLAGRRAMTPTLYGPRGDVGPRGAFPANRMQALEQYYGRAGARLAGRPHSALGSYHSEDEARSARTRRELGPRYAQQQQRHRLVSNTQGQLKLPNRVSDPRQLPATDDDILLMERKLALDTGESETITAMYENLRKRGNTRPVGGGGGLPCHKLVQDMKQPHTGSLIEDNKRFASLQRYGNEAKDDIDRFTSKHINEYGSLGAKGGSEHYGDILSGSSSIQPARSGAALYSQSGAVAAGGPSRPLMIDPSGFQQYGPEMRPRDEQSISGYSGMLVIHMLGVRGLQVEASGNNNASGSVMSNTIDRNLYCVVECDRIYKARTVAVQPHENNATNFDWDEIFDIDLFETKEITFLFYNWNPSLRHKLCSKGTIHLPWIGTLRSQHVHAFEMRLYETPGAMLYIKLEYHDLKTTFKRVKRDASGRHSTTRLGASVSASVEHPLFGVDLATVLARENSAFLVPIIIKRCTEEIEKRGIHLVGIYRLCGSALRKRHLREQFEKNSWLVDLSPENAPDINVITSLLKDYLRELPQPLFNKAMFDMINEGVSVCMPEDPNGNVKLMFSILECLDKASRNVVTFLMDHIKLVHLNADRNKMTSQALAICFGPLFSCHYESESVHKAIQVFKYLLDIWPARRSFNVVKKLDESKGTSLSEMQAMNMASSSGQQSKMLPVQATDRVDRAGYDRALLSQSGALGSSSYSYDYGKTPTSSLYGSSPPTSQHRFASSTTTSSTMNTTTTTTSRTTASLSGTNTTWNSSGSTTGGTGRMLPSTQNATRTISSYTSSEKIEVKVPAGSSGPSVLSPAAKAARDAARDAASSSLDYGHIGTRSAIPGTAHSYGASTASSATSSGYRSRLQTSDYDYDLSTTATATSGVGSAYTSVSPRMSSYTSDLTSGVGSGFTSAGDSFNVSSSLTATTRSPYLASVTGSSTSSTMANDAIYSTVNKPSSALKSSSYLYGPSSAASTIQSSGPIDVDELLYKSSQLDNFFTQQQQQQGSALNSPFVSSSVAQYDTSSISSPLTATRSTYHTGGNVADSSSPFTSMGFTSSVDNFAQARQQPQQSSLGGSTGLDNIKPLIGSSGTGATTTQLYPNKMTNSTAPAGDASATNAGGYYAGGSTGRFSNPAGSASSNYRSNYLGGNSFPEDEDDVR